MQISHARTYRTYRHCCDRFFPQQHHAHKVVDLNDANAIGHVQGIIVLGQANVSLLLPWYGWIERPQETGQSELKYHKPELRLNNNNAFQVMILTQ